MKRVNWIVGVMFLAMGFMMLGVYILLYQAYHWLQRGEWLPLSVIDGFRRLAVWIDVKTIEPGSFWEWVFSPTQWLGLFALLEWLPLCLFFPLLGLAILTAALNN